MRKEIEKLFVKFTTAICILIMAVAIASVIIILTK